MNLDNFLALSLEQRRKARVRHKPRGPYKCRPTRTPEELLRYLRTHNIRSVRQLRKIRKPDDPILYDVEQAFGSWQTAKYQAFGKTAPFALPRRPDPTYIINVVVEWDLWTRDAYQAAHRRMPDIIPSVYWAYALFGRSWRKVRWAAAQVSIKASLEQWMILRRRMGRHPSLKETAQAGVSLTPLKLIYTTPAELSEFLERFGCLAEEREKATTRNVAVSSSGCNETDISNRLTETVRTG